MRRAKDLAAETVQGAALALERVDDIHGGDGLSASVLGVGHCITDDVLEEHLEDTAGLFVDETGDALDTTTASETADRRLRDALDVITEDLAVTLGAALSESLTTFTSARHCLRFNESSCDDDRARSRPLGDRAASRERNRESLMSRLTTRNTRQSNNRPYLDIDILIMR